MYLRNTRGDRSRRVQDSPPQATIPDVPLVSDSPADQNTVDALMSIADPLGGVSLRCSVGSYPTNGTWIASSNFGDAAYWPSTQVHVSDGQVWLIVPSEAGAGHLAIAGVGAFQVTWVSGVGTEPTCTSIEWISFPTGAYGRVVYGDGTAAPSVSVLGCGGSTYSDEDGNFYLDVMSGAPCDLRAEVGMGGRKAASPAVRIHPVMGEDVEGIELRLHSPRPSVTRSKADADGWTPNQRAVYRQTMLKVCENSRKVRERLAKESTDDPRLLDLQEECAALEEMGE